MRRLLSRRLPLLVLVLVPVLLFCAATAAPAWAHGDLDSASPGPGDEVAPGGTVLSLTFAGLDPDGPASVAVSDADGAPLAVGGAVVLDAQTVCASSEPLPQGVLTLDYAVTGSDGHPSRGRYAFEVVPGGESPDTGACAAAELPPPGEAVPAADSDGGLTTVGVLFTLLAVVLAGAAVAARRRRGRSAADA